MNSELLGEIKNKLNAMIEQGEFNNRFIIIFGMNTPGDVVINYLRQRGIEVSAIIDNNDVNTGKSLMGVKVYKPDSIMLPLRNDILVLISSKYYMQMVEQLSGYGYKEKLHVKKLIELNNTISFSFDIDISKELNNEASENLKLYNGIINREKLYAYNRLILLPIKANGDACILGRWLKYYIDRQNVSCAVLVIGNSCKKVLELYRQYNVYVINENESRALIKLYMILGKESNIIPMQPYWLHYERLENIEYMNKLTFEDMYKYAMCQCHEEDAPLKYIDNINPTSDNSKHLKSKEIIISPYANSLPEINISFWNKLVKRLISQGFEVYTNAVASNEMIIENTKGLALPFDEMIARANKVKAVISIRNGLCDILANTNTKLIVLYPSKGVRYGTIRDYYSIKTNNTIEMNMCETDEMVEKIVKRLSEY